MPPARTLRCAVVAREYGRDSAPRNTSLNWTMPELVKSSVGSLPGTRLDERTIVWPFDSKNLRNFSRISAAFMAYWGGLLFCDASDGRRKAWHSLPALSTSTRADANARAKVVIDYTGSVPDR